MESAGGSAAQTKGPYTIDSLRRGVQWLKLPSPGPQDIPALDGLRAIAAILVVTYHVVGIATHNRPYLFGHDVYWQWSYLAYGVHLFFVLSGFLLFLPFARKMLDSTPLPSTMPFYMRRVRRIIPAYYACIVVLVLVNISAYLSGRGILTVLLHLLFLHDLTASAVFAIDGPFWTMAVEWQFYMLLPLVAYLVARLVGKSRSAVRIVGGVLLFVVAALAERWMVGRVVRHTSHIPGDSSLHWPFDTLTHVLMGFQGKFLEVFAIGMLCAVVYVVAVERQRCNPRLMRAIGPMLIVGGLLLAYELDALLKLGVVNGEVVTSQMAADNWAVVGGPGLVGLSFGLILLGVLLSGRWIRAVFEIRVLRAIGLISFSLYIWHLPILNGQLPLTPRLSLGARLVCAIVTAYVSYQLIERPFLRLGAARTPIGDARREQPPAPRPATALASLSRVTGIGGE